MAEVDTLKQAACDAIDTAADDLAALSKDIWDNPELAYKERHAHNVLTEFLDKYGFKTDRSYKIDTAFRATFGSRADGPNIAYLSEYDALPEIGHACGHNLIAEVGVAASIGLRAALKAAKRPIGQVTVLGTPAEEDGGGKIDLINGGVFNDIDVAMMAHPGAENVSRPEILANIDLKVTYRGKVAHAAGYPWEGVNALDAAVMVYNAISCFRQQMKPTWRVHCIITDGGTKCNIIPERASLEIGMRAQTNAELRQIETRVYAIIKSAAEATGCQVEQSVLADYSSMLHNQPLLATYEENISRIQTEVVPSIQPDAAGSTDMGNVSHVVPSIHPEFYIGGKAFCHTREFTGDAGHSRAQVYTLNQAKALAMTGVELLLEKQLLARVQEYFRESVKRDTGV